MTSEVVSSVLLGIIILETLEENEEENNVRSKTRKWIRRREEKYFYTNIVEELRVEDTKAYGERLGDDARLHSKHTSWNLTRREGWLWRRAFTTTDTAEFVEYQKKLVWDYFKQMAFV